MDSISAVEVFDMAIEILKEPEFSMS
jgi:hypothetical protein